MDEIENLVFEKISLYRDMSHLLISYFYPDQGETKLMYNFSIPLRPLNDSLEEISLKQAIHLTISILSVLSQ
jgi:hypothetical protein